MASASPVLPPGAGKTVSIYEKLALPGGWVRAWPGFQPLALGIQEAGYWPSGVASRNIQAHRYSMRGCVGAPVHSIQVADTHTSAHAAVSVASPRTGTCIARAFTN